MEDSLASAMCTRFEEDGTVYPSHLHKNVFTIEVLYNKDHNLSSTSAQGSFHETGISVFQFLSTTNSGIPLLSHMMDFYPSILCLTDMYQLLPAKIMS